MQIATIPKVQSSRVDQLGESRKGVVFSQFVFNVSVCNDFFARNGRYLKLHFVSLVCLPKIKFSTNYGEVVAKNCQTKKKNNLIYFLCTDVNLLPLNVSIYSSYHTSVFFMVRSKSSQRFGVYVFFFRFVLLLLIILLLTYGCREKTKSD